jgi:tripartite-type tricarboxylate transporter receptor subunit TctC
MQINRIFDSSGRSVVCFLFIVLATALSFVMVGGMLSPSAAEYPDRPINMIVPYAPGGGSDLGSKVMADRISKIIGQPIISVYKPGGGGALGAAYAAKAKPDGYTILVGSSTPLVLAPIVKKHDYKLEDFVSIGIYGEVPVWVAIKAESRWKTLKDLVEEAKKSPGKVTVSSYGKLTAADFVIEIFSKQAGIKLTHVPYKSSGEALTALLGGHADAAFLSGGGGGPLESGLVKMLVLAREQRLADIPQVPIFKEFGYPVALSPLHSLCVPKGTPKEVVEKLYLAQKKAIDLYSTEIKEGLRKVEIWASFSSPEESMQKFKKEYEVIFKAAEELGVVAK